MKEGFEEEAPQLPPTRGRHIKKRALKNKALSVPFNEKDLRDFVGGFHKRKKKRRKEAQKQQEEALRRKRIEERKKRKLERQFVLYGGNPPEGGSEFDETGEDQRDNDGGELNASVSGMATYDNGNVKVMVTTSEICHEEGDNVSKSMHSMLPGSVKPPAIKKHTLPMNKSKSFKKVMKHNPRSRRHSKRDSKKVSKRSKKSC